MANYSSYKIVNGDQFVGAAVTATKFSGSPNSSYGVKWFFGTMCRCSPGCCCLWSAPSDVQNMWIQMWGAGGNGTGACSCNRCHHYEAAQGGYYNSKMLETNGGCQYTVCAAGVYPCLSRECYGCMGCTSYVNGYNLSNFCAIGGQRGNANTSWTESCTSDNACCRAPGNNGGDFAMAGHQDGFSGHWNCHCTGDINNTCTTGAPFLVASTENQLDQCWIRCGCWTAPYATGGMSAMTTYCGSGHCGQGGQGGSGMVRITYL